MTNPIGKNIFYNGSGIPFESTNSEIGKMISILFSRPSSTASKGMLSMRNIKNVFYNISPEYLNSFRNELQRVLIHAFDNRKEVSDELFTLFIHQTLSLFPFAYPEEGFTVEIPVKNNGQWELDTYQLDKKFKLGNQFLLSPMPAYGFKSSNGGPPMLVFMGTTYPAGKGFLGTLLSDLTPGVSVGRWPFFCGRQELGEWLRENSGAHAMGISLGGALSLHAAKNFGEHISEVFAFMPPGLYPCELDAFANSTTQINLLFQNGDFVSNLGFFPEGENVNLYRVCEEQKANFLSAHARVFLTGENIKVSRGSPESENQNIWRKVLTGLHMVVCPLIFLLMLPVYLVVSLFKLLSKVISQISSVVLPFCLPQPVQIIPS